MCLNSVAGSVQCYTYCLLFHPSQCQSHHTAIDTYCLCPTVKPCTSCTQHFDERKYKHNVTFSQLLHVSSYQARLTAKQTQKNLLSKVFPFSLGHICQAHFCFVSIAISMANTTGIRHNLSQTISLSISCLAFSSSL